MVRSGDQGWIRDAAKMSLYHCRHHHAPYGWPSPAYARVNGGQTNTETNTDTHDTPCIQLAVGSVHARCMPPHACTQVSIYTEPVTDEWVAAEYGRMIAKWQINSSEWSEWSAAVSLDDALPLYGSAALCVRGGGAVRWEVGSNSLPNPPSRGSNLHP